MRDEVDQTSQQKYDNKPRKKNQNNRERKGDSKTYLQYKV